MTTFRYYLDRHIELDGDEHGEMGREMVDLLCGEDARKQAEAQAAAEAALRARLNFVGRDSRGSRKKDGGG